MNQYEERTPTARTCTGASLECARKWFIGSERTSANTSISRCRLASIAAACSRRRDTSWTSDAYLDMDGDRGFPSVVATFKTKTWNDDHDDDVTEIRVIA